MIESGDGWFVADNNGLARGPLSRAELQALRESGKIGDEHLVWTLRQAEWVPLRRALGMGQTIASGAAGGRVALAPSRPAAPATKPPATKPPAAPSPAKIVQPRQSDADWRKQLGREEPEAAKAAVKDVGLKDLQQRGTRAREGLRRLLARNIDLALLGGIGWALLSAIGLSTGLWTLKSPQAEMQSGTIAALILLVVAALPLEALLIGLLGYTPGRMLLGLRVVDARDAAPGISVAFNRSARVALMGQALLLPPFSIFAYAVAFGTLISKGRTHWDEALNLQVKTAALTPDRWWLALAATGIAWALLYEGVWMRLASELMAKV